MAFNIVAVPHGVRGLLCVGPVIFGNDRRLGIGGVTAEHADRIPVHADIAPGIDPDEAGFGL